ncbi:phage terminase small subunit [Aliivibrio sp. S4TY2]|uniref:phage terminase small subunit n=1 Tax=unclassified Aliivibrio TaxID=2645654 RepID=UPI002378DC42|nr:MULTISPECIES: phage terminase small subunit [unclassified Aliivibrio]MDD9154939.1 phage terminase small subunit [Aliivibrio sp. S4TY2]MDD9158698.1 phage terminase small subunit [Aliivibrio sp. S4TY1]MDD9162942.1 phage terminase small subunit [Aliivibrio sp. S4MY2]MDD9166697.1 phage terminase small subunit [Aliivibrio sp. S4MY4]MDD9184019.1 phage terminase small subunit [Aliivibrio sp. S4MY3]
MYTLLLKRKARTAKQDIHQVQLNEMERVEAESTPAQRAPLEEKPWDEIQNILKMDLEYSRTLAGSNEKVPFKKELIKKYTPLINKLLKSHGNNLEGLDVVWWFYQWQVDCGFLLQIHDDFKAAILNGLNAPANWKSNGQTAYCDIVFKYSEEAYKAKKTFNTALLSGAVNDVLEGKLATNAPLKVKMFRLAGDLLFDAEMNEEALALYEVVMAIDPNKGGRKIRVKELKEALGHE